MAVCVTESNLTIERDGFMELSRRSFLKFAGMGVVCGATAGFSAQQDARPNVIVILADDMGYSDIGCYGGEIDTPNLNRLAASGVRMSQFYNSARCCPTRASLMTGLHPHQTGIGHMTNSPGNQFAEDWGTDAYRGTMNKKSVTLGEVMRSAGYHTYMTGKWHLGMVSRDMWPLQRGFDKFYGILAGACNYYQPSGLRGITENNTQVEINDPDYYTTDAFTDNAIKFIREQQDEKPFFLYLAYNAPHWPLQAKKEDIDKYLGKYMCGWDEIRKQRHQKQVDMGLLEAKWGLTPRDARAWEEVRREEKRMEMDYRMATYAAQVDCIDQNVGKLVEYLEKSGKFDNTLIMFLADNGGCAEGGELGGEPKERINDRSFYGCCSYGRAWANASNTPFRRYKHFVHEGGIATPLIAHWPAATKQTKGTITHEPGYLIDIMATCVDVGAAKYPDTFNGNSIHKSEGKSLRPLIERGTREGHEYMFFEHEGHGAVRKGDWKAIKQDVKKEEWELYNLKNDRTELNNLAGRHPEILKDLSARWEKWALDVGCLPKPR